MAIPTSKNGALWLAFQSAKGTPATSPKYKAAFTGSPSFNPVQDLNRPDTTAQSREVAEAYLRRWTLEPSGELLCGPLMLAALAYWALGTVSTTGSGPYTHVVKPNTAGTLPYATLWIQKPNSEVERYVDCLCSSLTVSGSADDPVTASFESVAVDWLHQVTTPPSDPATADATYFRWVEALNRVKVATVANACITEASLTIENALEPVFGQAMTPCDIVAGTRTVSGSFGEPYETVAQQRRRTVLTGTTSGTTLTTSVQTTSFDVGFLRSASLTWDANVQSAIITEYPLNPDSGGGPTVVPAAWEAQPVATHDEVIVTAINSLATLP